MPQFIEPTEECLFIDGCYHGRRVGVQKGLGRFKVPKPQPRPVLTSFDIAAEPHRFETQTYTRRTINYRLAPTKDAKRERIRVFEVFALDSMGDEDACRELIYMLLRTPAKRRGEARDQDA